MMIRQTSIRIATENDLDAVEEIHNEIHREEENGITAGWLRSTVSIWEAEINNHHPNREKYERLKELAGQKGIDINDTCRAKNMADRTAACGEI